VLITDMRFWLKCLQLWVRCLVCYSFWS